MFTVPVLRSQRQEDCQELEASLGYVAHSQDNVGCRVRPYLNSSSFLNNLLIFVLFQIGTDSVAQAGVDTKYPVP